MDGYIQPVPVPMHWAEAELLHQAAWELEWATEHDRRHRDLAELLNYRDWLIIQGDHGSTSSNTITRVCAG